MGLVKPILFLSAACLVLIVGARSGHTMTKYKWTYRPLVVISQNNSELLAEQRRIISANQAGLRDRNIVVIYVVGNTVTADLGPPQAQTAAEIRSSVRASADAFRVLLVGKDGGTKLSSSSPLSARQVFSTVDAMPMRQNEVSR